MQEMHRRSRLMDINEVIEKLTALQQNPEREVSIEDEEADFHIADISLDRFGRICIVKGDLMT
jgi:hypothetical protein